MTDRTKPVYMIGVVAEMLKVHPQTLRFYEMQKQIEDLLAYVRESGGEVKEDAPREPREALVRSAANQLRSIDLF